MSFKETINAPIHLWVGDPVCQTAHDYLLKALTKLNANFLPSGSPLDTRRKGNLGEFIAMTIGQETYHKNLALFAANAIQPLHNISQPNLDLLWLFFGTNETDDFAILQEIKTTGDKSLGYADNLATDYAKLFGIDPESTLQSRLNVASNSLRHERQQPHHCKRVARMSGLSPETSPKIRLLPTLVHEKVGSDPVKKLVAIRSTIATAQNWPLTSIECWSIGLSDLDDRLARLATGQN